jgi:hypothetical protein
LSRANLALVAHGYRLGPDPASASACTIGGVIANNSSGMCCGTTQKNRGAKLFSLQSAGRFPKAYFPNTSRITSAKSTRDVMIATRRNTPLIVSALSPGIAVERNDAMLGRMDDEELAAVYEYLTHLPGS